MKKNCFAVLLFFAALFLTGSHGLRRVAGSSGFQVPTENLIAQFLFDNNTDTSGNGHHLSYRSGFSSSTGNGISTTEAARADHPGSTQLRTTGNQTVVMRLGIGANFGWGYVFAIAGYSHESSNDNVLFAITRSGSNLGGFHERGNGSNVNWSSYPFPENEFFDLAVVRDAGASEIRAYVNGALVSTFNMSGQHPTGGELAGLAFGGYPLSQYASHYYGTGVEFEHAHIYNRVLTEEEITDFATHGGQL